MVKSNKRKIVAQISAQLEEIARNNKVNLTKVIEDKMLESYKTNLTLSYAGRHISDDEEDDEYEKYASTGVLEDSVYVAPGSEPNTISIWIDDTTYPNGKSATDVVNYLVSGTKGGGMYMYTDSSGKKQYAHNYPTPKHLFEEHTKTEIKGFIDSLEGDIKAGKYSKRR